MSRPSIHNRLLKQGISAILMIAALWSNGVVVSGAGGSPPDFSNPIQSKDFYDVLVGISKFVQRVGFPVVVLFIILSGFMFVSAQGNKEKLDRAKSTFFWTVIGTAIVVGAVVIAEMIRNFAEKL